MEKLHKYSKSVSTCFVPMINIEEEYELQYNKDHIVEKVKIGEVDIHKECCSHFDEVGLINAWKMAVAHGENPLQKFAKLEPGVAASIDPNATLDEVNALIDGNNNKYADIAASLGITVEQLQAAVADGSIGQVIQNATAQQPAAEDGGNE